MSNLVIGRVDEDFINNLEESRDVLDLAMDHALVVGIISPHCLGDGFYTSNVGIGSLENVLQLGKLMNSEHVA